MKRKVILLLICNMFAAASTSFAGMPSSEVRVSYEEMLFGTKVPAYEKWGNIAVQETINRYHLPVLDYLHVGRIAISARQAEEKFKLWLRASDGKEFGVYVTIRFDPITYHMESIRFEETDR